MPLPELIIRPCDLCRSRRRRCIIPQFGQPCTVCVQAKSPCTFLWDRPKPTIHTQTEPPVHMQNNQTGSTSRLSPTTLISPINPTSNQTTSPLALAEFIRQVRQPLKPPSQDTSLYNAIDDEAGDDEELYLVGTASERDALVLNSYAPTNGLSASTLIFDSPVPGLRVRQVSSDTWFVFYRSLPYGPDQGGGGQSYEKVRNMVDEHLVEGITRR
jgi:hypothetical protein